MACSPDKLQANRLNSQKSCGPKSPEGKAISRRNALKHGLTGEGIVLPCEDVEAVAGRFDRMVEELAPKTETGLALTEQAAFLAVRLRRFVEHDHATLSENVRLAESRALEERLSIVDELFDGLHSRPYTCSRQLQSIPEGIDRMLELYAGVKADLTHPTLDLYDAYHFRRLESLAGRLPEDFPASRVKGLSQAMFGSYVFLENGEEFVEKLSKEERTAWAKSRLVEIIDSRVAKLRKRREELEPQAVLSRQHVAKAAMVDVSPRALLVQKYEAATRRSFLRALAELREVEERAAEAAEAAAELDTTPEEEEVSGAVASFFPGENPVAVEPSNPSRSEAGSGPNRLESAVPGPADGPGGGFD